MRSDATGPREESPPSGVWPYYGRHEARLHPSVAWGTPISQKEQQKRNNRPRPVRERRDESEDLLLRAGERSWRQKDRGAGLDPRSAEEIRQNIVDPSSEQTELDRISAKITIARHRGYDPARLSGFNRSPRRTMLCLRFPFVVGVSRCDGQYSSSTFQPLFESEKRRVK